MADISTKKVMTVKMRKHCEAFPSKADPKRSAFFVTEIKKHHSKFAM